MSDTTLNYGWTIPEEDDYQHVDNIRSPIIAIDALLRSKLWDTGVDTTGILSSESGWGNIGGSQSSARTKAGMCQVRIAYTRTGAGIVSNVGTGAMADSLICTMGTLFRPDVAMVNACMYGGSNLGGVILYPSGEVILFHGAPGEDVDTGDTLYSSFFFIA